MKIKAFLFAGMLFTSANANNAAIQDSKIIKPSTRAKNIKGNLALASLGFTGLEYIIGTDWVVKAFPKQGPNYVWLMDYVYKSPEFLHDIMAVALRDDSSALMRLGKVLSAYVEGSINSENNKDSKDWKSCKVKQVALSLAICLAVEALDTFGTKKIKNLPIKCPVRKNALRAVYKAILNIGNEGLLKPAIQDAKPKLLGIDSTLTEVVKWSFLREAAVFVLGECIRNDFDLQNNDATLLEEAALEAIKNENTQQEFLPEEETVLPAEPLVVKN